MTTKHSMPEAGGTTATSISRADQAAHTAATYVRSRTVLYRTPAGGPRGQWPADEYARQRRAEGIPAEVVMNLDDDAFLVIVRKPVS